MLYINIEMCQAISSLEINWSLSHQTFMVTPTTRLASIIVQGISYFPPPRFLLEYYKVL